VLDILTACIIDKRMTFCALVSGHNLQGESEVQTADSNIIYVTSIKTVTVRVRNTRYKFEI